jgi:DNA-binding transcriptional ArsR family regulator
MTGDVDIAAVAALIGDPARASLLSSLADSGRLPARELAVRAGIAPSTASNHLAKLTSAKLVVAERQGRHRFFQLADTSVADALEALATIAPPKPVRSLADASVAAALRHARTCYDHLAGRLGVEVAAALERKRILTRRDGHYELGSAARTGLGSLGLDVDAVARGRRPLVRTCLDWSERKPHLSGALGAAIAARFFELGWLRRRPANRSVELTPEGEAALRSELGLDLASIP